MYVHIFIYKSVELTREFPFQIASPFSAKFTVVKSIVTNYLLKVVRRVSNYYFWINIDKSV